MSLFFSKTREFIFHFFEPFIFLPNPVSKQTETACGRIRGQINIEEKPAASLERVQQNLQDLSGVDSLIF